MKKVIVCDLDGTLTESKSALSKEMADTICEVLATHQFAIISGGDWLQFQTQFLSHFNCPPERLKNLLLFPTSGAECLRYIEETWQQVYDELLSPEDRTRIFAAFDEALKKTEVEVNHLYGEIIEDRGEQITFSGCGQHAPTEVKAVWDPDQVKRLKIVAELQMHIPEFEIEIGGMTSIDITKRGVNKAYAINKIKEILNVSTDEIVFLGDALYPGGNDTKARDAGVECIQVSGPSETQKILMSYTQDGGVSL